MSADVLLSDDGTTATVNGRTVAMSGLEPSMQEQLRTAAGMGGRARTQAMSSAGQELGKLYPVEGTLDPQAAGSGGRAARYAQRREEGFAAAAAQEAAAQEQPPEPGPSGAAPPLAASPGPVSRREPVQRSGGPSFRKVTNSTTSTQDVSGGEERRSDLGALYGNKAATLNERARIEAERADAQRDTRAEAEADRVIIRDKSAARVAQVRQEGEKEAQDYLDTSRQRRAEASRLQEEGHDFWEDKGTGMRIMAGIGAAFSALSTYGQGPNVFLQQLNRAMDREERAHQGRIKGLRGDAERDVTFYDIARKQTDDDVEAQLLTRQMQLDAVDSMLKQKLAEAGPGERAVALQEAQNQLEGERIATDQKLAARITTNISERTVPLGSGRGAGSDERYIPGLRTTDQKVLDGLSNTDIQTVRKLTGAGNSMISIVEKMERLREQYGTEAFTSEAAAEFSNLAKQYHAAVSVMTEQGSMTAADIKMMRGVIPEDLSPEIADVTRIFGQDSKLNKIRGAKRTLLGMVNSKLKPYGGALEGTSAPKTRLRSQKSGAAR